MNVSSKEAENILYALSLRVMQLRTLKNGVLASETLELGKRLNNEFEKQFGWDRYDRMTDYLYPMKSLKVTMYPVNPNPKPEVN